MLSIDKNDVDISKLFKWGKQISLFDKDGEEVLKLYIRLVNDAELNRARVVALRDSAVLRRELNTEDTDERLAFIPQIDLVETENMVEIILTNQVRSIYADVLRDMDFNIPVEPKSDATLEELEKYQEEIDNWPKKRTEKIAQEASKVIAKERKRLSGLPREELQKILEKVLIDNICEESMNKTFNEQCVLFGTYTDEKFTNRAFTKETFEELLPEFKAQLIEHYNDLDLSLEELKK